MRKLWGFVVGWACGLALGASFILLLGATRQEAQQDFADGDVGSALWWPANPANTGYEEIYWIEVLAQDLADDNDYIGRGYFQCRLKQEGPDLDGDGTGERSRLYRRQDEYADDGDM